MTCHTKALERWHMIKSWHQPDIFLFHIKTFMEKSVLSPLPVVDVAASSQALAIEVAAWLALKMEFILISGLYWIRGCQPEESCSCSGPGVPYGVLYTISFPGTAWRILGAFVCVFSARFKRWNIHVYYSICNFSFRHGSWVPVSGRFFAGQLLDGDECFHKWSINFASTI